MARKPPVIHARDHLSGGADPLDFPPGLLAGYGGVDLAVTTPGNLLYRYQLGEASGAALDTSGFAGGPRDLSYHEYTSGADPAGGAHATWDGTQAATRALLDHPEFGSGDDGLVRFNYKQLHDTGGHDPFDIIGSYTSFDYPGAHFAGPNSLANWGTVGDVTKSFSIFFKAGAAGVIEGGAIAGNMSYSGSAYFGWALLYDHSRNLLSFHVGYIGGANSGATLLTSPGALTPGHMYHCVITWNGTTWLMYLNGAVVATTAGTVSSTSGADLEVGSGGIIYANNNGPGQARGFFWGEVDEIDGYSKVLSLAEVQAINAARGAGSGTTVDTVTIGVGNPTNPATPAAISSALPGGGNAPAGQMVTADGSGGTTYAYPTMPTYHNGVLI